MNYLSVGNDAKTVKGEKKGYLTGILYLAPAQEAGGRNLCPFSTAGCRAVCLFTAGRGAMRNVYDARVSKTRKFLADPDSFISLLKADIELLTVQAHKKGMTPAVRLNGTTDIMWSKYGIMQAFPQIQFYGYTKWPADKYPTIEPNEHVTFSHSEHPYSWKWSDQWFERGVNTAVVFRGGLPALFQGRPVIDGDESDLRMHDPEGIFVGLKAKGQARPVGKGDGFVVDYEAYDMSTVQKAQAA